MTSFINLSDRRKFLGFLAASPLGAAQAFAQSGDPAIIKKASDALNVFELEAVAKRTIRKAHWGYLETGVLDDATVQANRDGYARWGINASRLRNVSQIDQTCELLGETWQSPIVLAPVSAQRAFHQDAERPVAKAARSLGALQILSTLANISIETVISDRNGPIWFQLYPTNDRSIAKGLVERADKAGATAIVLTVDLLAGGMRRETQQLYTRMDNGNCNQCHDRTDGFYDFLKRRPMFGRLDISGIRSIGDPKITWDFLKRLRDWTDRKILVKGIMNADDAQKAITNGADGIVISNHGGRSEESLVGTCDVLPEIANKVDGRIPILVDGGIRRGTDAFKALALGADAVCIGRPYIWGLSAFGQEGVETTLRLLQQELATSMEQVGVTRIADISREHVRQLT